MKMRVPSNHQTISKNIYLELAFMRVLYLSPSGIWREKNRRIQRKPFGPGHIGGRRALSPLCQSCFLRFSLITISAPPRISCVTIPAPCVINFCNLLNFSRPKRISERVMQSTFITSVKSWNLNYLSSQQIR